MEIKSPLLMQGFQMPTVGFLSKSINVFNQFEQQRGSIIGVDFLPLKQFVGDTTGQTIHIEIGGQQIVKDAPFIDFVPYFANDHILLPIRVNANGGQSITSRIENTNGIQIAGGELAVFYENPYDKNPLDFFIQQGNGLTLKRESFSFTVPPNSKVVSKNGKFTSARGYGNVCGVSVRASSVGKATSNPLITLLFNGVQIIKDVSTRWFRPETNRKFQIFPINQPPSSTNNLELDNSTGGAKMEVIVTLYYAG